MNKVINVYELLGLIKDGKAPRIIRIFEDLIYVFDEKENFYYNNGSSLYRMFYDLGNALEEKVEILEEDKPIIEKLYIGKNDITYDDGAIDDDELVDNFIDVKDKLNEVIDYINRKEDN